MYITEQERERLLNMDRQGMIEYLCFTGDIAMLPPEQQGNYLFGKTKNNRAICLTWRDRYSGCITRDSVLSAYHEIGSTGLNLPFLFFGLTTLYWQSDVFTFAQIPWCFEQQRNPVLRILQSMDLRGNLHVPALVNQKPPNAIPLVGVRQMNQALRASFHNQGGKIYCLRDGEAVQVFHAKQPRNSPLQGAGSNGHWFTPDKEEVWVEPTPGDNREGTITPMRKA